jgi:putative FmdB family regulatory protein
MPKYFYCCNICEAKFDIYHSMSETKEDCPKCKKEKSLKKLPSNFNIKKDKSLTAQTGHVVKQSIQDFKEDLEEQKEQLKERFFEENE